MITNKKILRTRNFFCDYFDSVIAKNIVAKLLIIILLSSLFLSIFSICSSYSSALGIAPSIKILNYDTQEHTLNARVINNENKNTKVVLYAQGELAEYVKISDNSLKIKSTDYDVPFTYTIKLPENLAPGTKSLDIMIVETPDDFRLEENKTMVVSLTTVTHQLKVNVPYPGLFAEGYLFANDGNVNDTITFTTNIINKGSNVISAVDGELVIKGSKNEELYRVKSNVLNALASQNSGKLVVNWVADVPTGVYSAEFITNYDGKQLFLRKTFNVGSFNIDIKNIKVNDFKLGTIAKFNVDIINGWNEQITTVYADMQILDTQGNVISKFRTNSVDANPSESTTIYGYWDTKDAVSGIYYVKIILHYAERTSEKIFMAVVDVDSITVQDTSVIGNVIATKDDDKSTSLLTIVVVALIIIIIGIFVYFKVLKKKEV